MKALRSLSAAFIALALCWPALAVEDQCGDKPGASRWQIKTSVPPGSNLDRGTHVDLLQLVNRPNFDLTPEEAHEYENKFFPKQGNRPIQEGDIVSTIGWLNYVHCKDDDNDYHVQISSSQDGLNGCLIVEVPHPDYVNDPGLKHHVAEVRTFLRNTFYGGDMPTGKPNRSREVEVVGQLFFDAFHLREVETKGPGGGRGVNCSVHTLWEIHPITAIRLAP